MLLAISSKMVVLAAWQPGGVAIAVMISAVAFAGFCFFLMASDDDDLMPIGLILLVLAFFTFIIGLTLGQDHNKIWQYKNDIYLDPQVKQIRSASPSNQTVDFIRSKDLLYCKANTAHKNGYWVIIGTPQCKKLPEHVLNDMLNK